MINLDELSEKFYDDMSKIIDENAIQILANRTLYTIRPEDLKLPRLIFGFIGYKQSEYDFNKFEYSKDIDLFENKTDTIPTLSLRFRIYSDDENSNTIFNEINKLNNYYRNPYIEKFNGDVVVDSVGTVSDLLIDDTDIATMGYEFTIDFRMVETLETTYDYANEVEYELDIVESRKKNKENLFIVKEKIK